jgi:hypothetical protein
MEGLVERKKEKRKCTAITLITIESDHNYVHHKLANNSPRKIWHETEAWNKNTNATPSALRQ